MAMVIRQFGPGDEQRGMHGRPGDERRERLTLLAEIDGVIAGRGSISETLETRLAYSVEIDVEPAFRRRGIGTALFCELVRQRPRPYPMTTRAMASHPGRRAFADALGFEVLFECPGTQVDPTADAVRSWCGEHGFVEGLTLVPFASADWDGVLSAYTSMFTWTHQYGDITAAPPNELGTLLAGQLAESDRTWSQVAVSDGRIVAVCPVVLDSWEGRNFAWPQTAEEDQPNGDAIVAATVARTLDLLAEQGFRCLEFEGHADHAHIGVVTSVPAIGADPLAGLIFRG